MKPRIRNKINKREIRKMFKKLTPLAWDIVEENKIFNEEYQPPKAA